MGYTIAALVQLICNLRQLPVLHNHLHDQNQNLLFGDVLLQVTAVVADLSSSKDAGLKKAVARVKRATKRRSP